MGIVEEAMELFWGGVFEAALNLGMGVHVSFTPEGAGEHFFDDVQHVQFRVERPSQFTAVPERRVGCLSEVCCDEDAFERNHDATSIVNDWRPATQPHATTAESACNICARRPVLGIR